MIGKDFKSVIEKSLFPVVPLVNYSKIPIVPWSNKDFWIKDNNELEKIGATYKREINGKVKGGSITGFSLICGKVSNIMILDIDINHGDNAVNGDVSFKDFIKDLPEEVKAEIFNTLSIKTPRGGTHLYYKYKEGLRNKANYIPGVDIRTDGGLIVVPQSKVRVSGEVKEYIPEGKEIQEMPQQLFDKLIKLDKRPTDNIVNNTVSDGKTIMSKSKYYKMINEGEGRDSSLISWLGSMIKNNSNMRIKDNLLPQAITYSRSWFNPPLSNEVVEKKVDSILKYANPSYCDNKGNIDNWNLVQYILKDKPSYTKGNLWYLYDNEKGFYDYTELKGVQKMFFNYPINNKDKTVMKSKNFAELLMLNSEDAREIHDEKKYINCINGIIDIEKNQLLPHGPEYKLEIQLKAKYILDGWEEKFNSSEFKKFLDTTLDEGSLLTLQESWGIMISPHAREVQNCIIYKGEGSNGKSVAFDIQEALIGDNKHICGIGLGDFGEPFVISMAEGKHVNIVRDDELSGKTVNKFFKSMVCGEPVTVNKKNKDLVRLGFNMTMFFGLNRLPSASDKSTGFFRRPVIIPFNNSFGTEKEVARGLRDIVKDVGIADKIIENELDIVFMWAYEGLKRIKANKWKITVSEESEREMEEYKEEVDSSYLFFNTMIISTKSKGTRVEKDKIYMPYRSWCYSNGTTPMNKVQFGRQFKSFGLKDTVSHSVRYWLDIEVDNTKVKEVTGNNIYPFA